MKQYFVRICAHLLLIVFGIALAFAVGEIYARIVTPAAVFTARERLSYISMLQPHPLLRRVLKPNYSGQVTGNGVDFSVKFNSRGLRDREFPYYKKKGVCRILILGDSFTFGYGVEQKETFPKLLERKLQQQFPHQDIEIINTAVPGWGSSQERDFLRTEGVKYKPDIILAGFFLNDAEDSFNIAAGRKDSVDYWAKKDAFLTNYAKSRPGLFLHFFLTKHSNFYVLLNDKFNILSNKLNDKFGNKNTIGSTRSPDYESWDVFPQGISLIDLSKPVTNNIKIKSWEIFSLCENKVRLKIWRPLGNGRWVVADESELIDIKTDRTKLRLKRELVAKPGDYLGIFALKGNITRNLPYPDEESYNKVYGWGDIRTVSFTDGHDVYGGYNFKANYTLLDILPEREKTATQVQIVKTTKESSASKIVTPTMETVPYLNLYYPPWGTSWLKAWDSTMNDLLTINKTGESIGAKVVFVFLPDKFVSNKDKLDGNPALDHPEGMFAQFMMKNKMDFINLVPLFKKSTVSSLYIHDGHFNVNGNILATEGIFVEAAPVVKSVIERKH